MSLTGFDQTGMKLPLEQMMDSQDKGNRMKQISFATGMGQTLQIESQGTKEQDPSSKYMRIESS